MGGTWISQDGFDDLGSRLITLPCGTDARGEGASGSAAVLLQGATSAGEAIAIWCVSALDEAVYGWRAVAAAAALHRHLVDGIQDGRPVGGGAGDSGSGESGGFGGKGCGRKSEGPAAH